MRWRFKREPKTHVANIGQVVLCAGKAYMIYPDGLHRLPIKNRFNKPQED